MIQSLNFLFASQFLIIGLNVVMKLFSLLNKTCLLTHQNANLQLKFLHFRLKIELEHSLRFHHFTDLLDGFRQFMDLAVWGDYHILRIWLTLTADLFRVFDLLLYLLFRFQLYDFSMDFYTTSSPDNNLPPRLPQCRVLLVVILDKENAVWKSIHNFLCYQDLVGIVTMILKGDNDWSMVDVLLLPAKPVDFIDNWIKSDGWSCSVAVLDNGTLASIMAVDLNTSDSIAQILVVSFSIWVAGELVADQVRVMGGKYIIVI